MTIATGARGWGAMLATVASLAAVMLTAGLVARGQEGEGKARRDDQKALEERWGREVAAYRVVAHSEPEVELTLKSEPVLRWTNPVRKPTVGLVFLWLGQGRPEAVSCFYRVHFEGRLVEAHEFVSLAPVGLTAVLRGQTVWSPTGSGLQPRPITGAPRPAKTPAERLRQLHALVREFHASVDVDTEPTELRLLPQPVARFAGGDANATADAGGLARPPDGALFGFVLATDPEAWLVIDERPGPGGPAWHYAFARMSNRSLTARHRERPVWDAPRDRDDNNPRKPFCVRWDVGPRP
jgi:hypothetical protein